LFLFLVTIKTKTPLAYDLMLLNLLNLFTMSNSSIYESKWTNLVFENKNKEYGAYQLRHENAKTTISALLLALLLIAAFGSLTMLISKLTKPAPIENTPALTIDDRIITVDLDHQKVIPPTPVVPQVQQQSAAPATDMTQLTNPVVAAPDQVVDNIAPNTINVPVVDNTATGIGTAVNATPTTGKGDSAITQPVDNGNTIVNTTALDKLPEFPGGINKFYTYVANNFDRPELDSEKILKVYVSFVIEKDGSITDIAVKNDPGYGMGKEAVRVLKSLKTKWTPGILNGKPVRTAYNLPITIKTE
jgi:protein TonB